MASKAPYAVAYRTDGPAWIGLPGVASNGDADKMFSDAGLADWNVESRLLDTGAQTDRPDFEIVGQTPAGLWRFGTAKERYTPVQNEEVKRLADHVASGDATPTAMGAFGGYRKVFASFALGESITLDPNGQADTIGLHLTIMTSHDGSLPFVAMIGNVRPRCQNMLTSIRASAMSTFKLRHTQTAGERIMLARTALGVAFREGETFQKDMEALNAQAVTDNMFWDMVQDMYPRPEKDVRGSVKKWEDRTDLIMGLWNNTKGTMSNLDKTAYRAYNTLNEALTWYRPVRGGNVENALLRPAGFDAAFNRENVGLYRRALALG